MRRDLFVLVALVLVATCSPEERADGRQNADSTPSLTASDYARAADSLDKADAANHALAAVGNGDRRLLGVQGYSLVIPGVPAQRMEEYTRRLGVRLLKGTSDSWQNEEHKAYNVAAGRYADRYNRALLQMVSPH
jgi:hypothetical protein